MEKSFASIGVGALLSASLLMPMSTLAYLSPDQVFGSTPENTMESSSSSEAGVSGEQVTRRNADQAVEAQQRQSAEQRAAAQESLKPSAPPEVQSSVSSSVSSDESLGLFEAGTLEERRQERIDSENATPVYLIGNGDDGAVLHSGAQLVTSTGPVNTLAFIVLALAAASTFAFAEYRKRSLRTIS